MKAQILNQVVTGLQNIIEAMYYEGVEEAILFNGRTIFVYGNGTYEISE